MTASKFISSALFVCIASGCAQTVPKEALEFTPVTLEQRQLQTRRFETKDEKVLLSAGAAVLQDLGFAVGASATDLGFLLATKTLSAVEPGQVAAAIGLAILAGLARSSYVMPIDHHQLVRVSFTTKVSENFENNVLARVTFQRIVWNTQNQISKLELISDPKFYQEFFEKLSKSVFLEAHEF